MKKLIRMTIACFFLVTGCDDLFEKDLTGKQVALVAPSDNVTTCITRQLFLWEKLQGATTYRMLIVTPDLRQAQACLLDTLLEEQHFEYEFTEGVYTWMIRAENSASAGEFTSRLLVISPKNIMP